MSDDLLRALEARKSGPSEEMQAIAARYAARREMASRSHPRPAHWMKPAYGSQQYRYALSMGWITDDEQRADHDQHQKRRQRAKESAGKRGSDPGRWSNPAPPESRQYGADYSTEAARDSRLTMGAKALLQIIRARCGRTMQTAFTKGTMANLIGRSTRTVQRYIAELERFGYIKTEIRRGWGGLHSGLIVMISEKVRPFYARHEALAVWMIEQTAESSRQIAAVTRNTVKTFGFLGRTGTSHTNQINNNLLLKYAESA
jgi:hypothetical protein